LAGAVRLSACDVALAQGLGSATSAHPLVRKACRLAMFFFLYSGFLFVLKWNQFWKWILALGFENRNKTEGFLILVSTLV
jgi:hypothetical protein